MLVSTLTSFHDKLKEHKTSLRRKTNRKDIIAE